ncbi:carboxylesterase/lipase family protein [Oceanicoccus sp. KOV_DT_Chl]|uniref:carboxylesterase/lipase family protein n=1 Tax=Oceanicoccus sp. KOV_DT_Chl TaxID=1904639 RepID=UPI000C7969FE|nr:carboxylesterase family protein [Oceanicoccus sp. KOV_DT_Chl]
MFLFKDVQGCTYNQDDDPTHLKSCNSVSGCVISPVRFIVSLLFCFLISQTADASEPTLRLTPQGKLLGVRNSDHDVWLGIPYAEPPTGSRRWKRPAPPSPWQGTRAAHSIANPCSQYNYYNRNNPLEGDEDCLYLNVWTPQYTADKVPTGNARLPVMVWIHGGSNVLGHGGSYDGGTLAASQQALVITVNYRLGVFGWFSHPALSEETDSPADASGNYAVLDIIQALHWVKTNVSAFGGDPTRVTVFGESAGGANVYSLLVSPLAKDLFQRAIIQSGGTASISTAEASHYIDDGEPGSSQSSGEVLLQLLINEGLASNRDSAKRWVGHHNKSEVADYLRRKSMAEFHLAYQQLYQHSVANDRPSSFPQQFRDGSVIPIGGIHEALQQGMYHHMPMILGSTRDEFSLLLSLNPRYVKPIKNGVGIEIRSLPHYQLAAEYLSKMLKAHNVDEPADSISRQQQADVFVYRFDWDQLSPAPWLNNLSLGATHGLDVPFVFGHRNLGPEFFQLSLMHDRSLPSYRALSQAMMSYWVQFAATGDPGTGQQSQLLQWNAWSPNAKHQARTMHFDSAADNYLHMSPLRLDTARVLKQLERDSRVKALPNKEQFLHDLFSTMKSLRLLTSDTVQHPNTKTSSPP